MERGRVEVVVAVAVPGALATGFDITFGGGGAPAGKVLWLQAALLLDDEIDEVVGRELQFVLVLVIGFVVEWKKGALDWE